MLKPLGAAVAAFFLACSAHAITLDETFDQLGQSLAGMERALTRTPGARLPTYVSLLEKTFKVQACEHTGSAVAISPRRLITNHHVIEGCDSLKIDGVSVKVIADDKAADLVVLEAPSGKLIKSWASIATGRVAPGDPVFACGAPLGIGPFCTEGRIGVPLTDTPFGPRIISTSPIAPGNSGGPLFDADGRVVGINQGVPRIPTGPMAFQDMVNIGIAIPAAAIRKFLRGVK